MGPNSIGMKELDDIRVKLKLYASREMLKALLQVLQHALRTMPAAERAGFVSGMRSRLASQRIEYASLAIPELPPEQSDLFSAEMQEAFEEVFQQIERSLDQVS